MAKKGSVLGKGANRTTEYKPPKEAIASSDKEDQNKVEKTKTKQSNKRYSFILTPDEQACLSAVAKKNNLNNTAALHIIIADYMRRHNYS